MNTLWRKLDAEGVPDGAPLSFCPEHKPSTEDVYVNSGCTTNMTCQICSDEQIAMKLQKVEVAYQDVIDFHKMVMPLCMPRLQDLGVDIDVLRSCTQLIFGACTMALLTNQSPQAAADAIYTALLNIWSVTTGPIGEHHEQEND